MYAKIVCAKIVFFLLLNAAAAGHFLILSSCFCVVVSSSSMHISLTCAILNKPLCMIPVVCWSAVSSYLGICKAKAVKLLLTVLNTY